MLVSGSENQTKFNEWNLKIDGFQVQSPRSSQVIQAIRDQTSSPNVGLVTLKQPFQKGHVFIHRAPKKVTFARRIARQGDFQELPTFRLQRGVGFFSTKISMSHSVHKDFGFSHSVSISFHQFPSVPISSIIL